ncbi:MAG TPA: bifunctional 5,10-methylenetetrahydrofolate dehydrogenase/5,10-methenyltetrahydrofolate cyclohydrolase [Candidatus Magasanikbacteria bacterium]|nr:bifunctional 5,10-methylenetetrahydrofolate dehydrogenase/5,10-methenyltetrahydrofolate cyclohydrolase [Candidatus Magasanikbacteria bacterium]
MKAVIVDGKQLSEKILASLRIEVVKLKKQGVIPKLAIVHVGDHQPSKTYIKRKEEAARSIGVDFELHTYPAATSKEDIISYIKKIQKDKKLSGLIVQLPLPEPLYTAEVLNAINPEVDVDCLTDGQLGKLVMKTNVIAPPTPGAVCEILEMLNVNVQGKHVVIVGAGALVGKPLSIMLLNKLATVTVCNSHTKNLKSITKKADIIISAVGKKDLITKSHVKKGCIVIDTGIVFENKKMYGDVDFARVSKRASYITPTPGGVGPVTVALLLKNTVTQAKRNNK